MFNHLKVNLKWWRMKWFQVVICKYFSVSNPAWIRLVVIPRKWKATLDVLIIMHFLCEAQVSWRAQLTYLVTVTWGSVFLAPVSYPWALMSTGWVMERTLSGEVFIAAVVQCWSVRRWNSMILWAPVAPGHAASWMLSVSNGCFLFKHLYWNIIYIPYSPPHLNCNLVFLVDSELFSHHHSLNLELSILPKEAMYPLAVAPILHPRQLQISSLSPQICLV